MSAFINGHGGAINETTPIGGEIREDGPHQLHFGGQGRNVHTLLLKAAFTTGLTAINRLRPPAITRIELWGQTSTQTAVGNAP